MQYTNGFSAKYIAVIPRSNAPSLVSSKELVVSVQRRAILLPSARKSLLPSVGTAILQVRQYTGHTE